MNRILCCLSIVLLTFFGGSLLAGEAARTIVAPPAAGQLRVVTWNVQFLGRRNPPRSDAQLKLMAERMREWRPAVIAMQEIQSNQRIKQLVALLGPTWKVNPGAGWDAGKTQEDETCLLWDTSKVKCLATKAHLKDYRYTNRPPFSGTFQPTAGGDPFVVISNHAYPGGSDQADQHRVRQGKFYRQLVLAMLADEQYPDDILLVGDFNGTPGNSPHTTIQPPIGSRRSPSQDEPLLHLLAKSNGAGTMAGRGRGADIDHIYVTQTVLRRRLAAATSVVIRPAGYGETAAEFDRTYSDHLPVYVDIAAQRQAGSN